MSHGSKKEHSLIEIEKFIIHSPGGAAWGSQGRVQETESTVGHGYLPVLEYPGSGQTGQFKPQNSGVLISFMVVLCKGKAPGGGENAHHNGGWWCHTRNLYSPVTLGSYPGHELSSSDSSRPPKVDVEATMLCSSLAKLLTPVKVLVSKYHYTGGWGFNRCTLEGAQFTASTYYMKYLLLKNKIQMNQL